MNNGILQASRNTLSKTSILLAKLSNEELCDNSISPYHSSIGTHIRHILDFYQCIFIGMENGLVDLTNRNRDLSVERDCDCANDYLESILNTIEGFKVDLNKIILVRDDLGQGIVQINYTIGSLFAQANSHTIHHYAIINYILDRLEISMEDDDFGLNPTSPKKEMQNG
ncbi:MAG: DinB family protein [Bacteroidia bacterium]|nr:DinB family protein [Bacteroidia bacterium]NNK28617.1 DinB family protein [Flavobacteriaceae bacterium]